MTTCALELMTKILANAKDDDIDWSDDDNSTYGTE